MLDGSTTRILITGASGFLGGAILAFLANESYRKDLKGQLWFFKRGDSVEKTISSFRPDIIIHSAGEIYEEDKMFSSNIELTYSLLREAEKAGTKKFVYFGSSSEYGRYNRGMREDDQLRPTTLYEATKGGGSLLCEASKLDTLIVRPFSVYGPFEPERRFIPKIYRAYKDKTLLSITPGVHDFIYIDDFVKIVWARMQHEGKEILNAGTGVEYTNEAVVRTFEEVVGSTINKKFTPAPGRVYDSNCWKNDSSYLKSVYEEPLTTLKEGLSQYVRFREKNPAAKR